MIAGRKIGFMPSGSYNAMDADQICESLRRIGYDAVEWTLVFASPRNRSTAELRKLKQITESAGLVISEVVVQQDLVVLDESERKERIAFIRACIEAYADAGIGTINLFTGPVPWGKNPLIVGEGISEGVAWEMLLCAFDELVPLAEKKGVILAVENVFGMLCHDFFTLKFLIDYYHSASLRVNYDPSHDILAGHTDIGWIVRQWGRDNIKHVHLKDAVGIQKIGQFLFPLPGEGNVDWKEFVNAFNDIGYEGVMSVEFESFAYAARILKGDWEQVARLSFDHFKLLLEA